MDGTAGYMLGTAGYMVVDHVIIVSAPVQKIGFWGFSDMVRTLGSGCGACWDRGLGLGLGLDNKLGIELVSCQPGVRERHPKI